MRPEWFYGTGHSPLNVLADLQVGSYSRSAGFSLSSPLSLSFVTPPSPANPVSLRPASFAGRRISAAPIRKSPPRAKFSLPRTKKTPQKKRGASFQLPITCHFFHDRIPLPAQNQISLHFLCDESLHEQSRLGQKLHHLNRFAVRNSHPNNLWWASPKDTFFLEIRIL